jgi:hypothetical protein
LRGREKDRANERNWKKRAFTIFKKIGIFCTFTKQVLPLPKKRATLKSFCFSISTWNFFKNFAALASLSSQSAFDTNNGSLSMLPLPLALGCTVVLPASN